MRASGQRPLNGLLPSWMFVPKSVARCDRASNAEGEEPLPISTAITSLWFVSAEKVCNQPRWARLLLKKITPAPLRNDHMKIRTNFGHLVLALLGLTLCLADAMSAAERAKTIRTQDHRGGAVSGQLTGTFGNQVQRRTG